MKPILTVIAALTLAAAAFGQEPKTKSPEAPGCEKCETVTPEARPAAAPAPGTAVLTLSGVRCDGCAMKLRGALTKVPGVRSATVDVKGQRALLLLGSKAPSAQTLRKAVEGAGHYKLVAAVVGKAK